MNSTLISQFELSVRPFAPVRSAHADVTHVPVAHQSATRSYTTTNPVVVMPTVAWLGGFGSKVNASICASKRLSTRSLSEALT